MDKNRVSLVAIKAEHIYAEVKQVGLYIPLINILPDAYHPMMP